MDMHAGRESHILPLSQGWRWVFRASVGSRRALRVDALGKIVMDSESDPGSPLWYALGLPTRRSVADSEKPAALAASSQRTAGIVLGSQDHHDRDGAAQYPILRSCSWIQKWSRQEKRHVEGRNIIDQRRPHASVCVINSCSVKGYNSPFTYL